MPNKRILRRLAGASLTLLAFGACVPRSTAPAPAPAPAPRAAPVQPAPPPSSPVAPPPTDWDVAPLSPGDWRYTPSAAGSSASFSTDRMGFMIACRQGQISLLAVGAEGRALVIRTSYGTRRFPMESGELASMEVRLPVTDPLLDRMAFSRGRILVAAEGGKWLIVPAWPEIARVIEDCRGP